MKARTQLNITYQSRIQHEISDVVYRALGYNAELVGKKDTQEELWDVQCSIWVNNPEQAKELLQRAIPALDGTLKIESE